MTETNEPSGEFDPEKEYTARVASAQSFEELEEVIKDIGEIPHKTEILSADELIKRIKDLDKTEGRLLATVGYLFLIPKTYGIQDKVEELLKAERLDLRDPERYEEMQSTRIELIEEEYAQKIIDEQIEEPTDELFDEGHVHREALAKLAEQKAVTLGDQAPEKIFSDETLLTIHYESEFLMGLAELDRPLNYVKEKKLFYLDQMLVLRVSKSLITYASIKAWENVREMLKDLNA